MIIVNDILDVEQYLNKIEGVIFDLDDTLYSEKDYVRSGYKEIARNYPDIENAECRLWEFFLKGDRAINKVFAEAGLSEEKENALMIYRMHMPKIELYAGVQEMITRLKTSGKKIGIITDGRPEGQKNKIEALRLNVDQVIITDELGGVVYRKPNKKAFELMQNRLQIAFDRMVYIGDNLAKDFIAPEELGMETIYFKNSDGLYYMR